MKCYRINFLFDILFFLLNLEWFRITYSENANSIDFILSIKIALFIGLTNSTILSWFWWKWIRLHLKSRLFFGLWKKNPYWSFVHSFGCSLCNQQEEEMNFEKGEKDFYRLNHVLSKFICPSPSPPVPQHVKSGHRRYN